MTNGKGDKVANNFRTEQWEKSKLWSNADKKKVEYLNDSEVKELVISIGNEYETVLKALAESEKKDKENERF